MYISTAIIHAIQMNPDLGPLKYTESRVDLENYNDWIIGWGETIINYLLW